MSAEKITAETRTEFGKGAARRIRRADKVPAVIYGHGNDPLHVTLPGHETWLALKRAGSNALLELALEDGKQLVLTKQVQVDPIRRTLDHIDFIVVVKGEKVTVEVPLHLVGEAAPETLVVLDNNVLLVEAEATHIPEFIEVTIEGVEAGTQIHAKDVVLPKGSTLLSDEELLVVNITAAATTAEVEAELAEAEAEAGIERDETETETETAEVAEGAEAVEGDAQE